MVASNQQQQILQPRTEVKKKLPASAK